MDYREAQHKLGALVNSNPYFTQWYWNQTEVEIANPDHHHLIPDFKWKDEFMAQLAVLAPVLREGRPKNRREAQLTKPVCFQVLKYAKKWLGAELPGNLSKLTKDQLRSHVNRIFPDKLPKCLDVTYKGVLAILRGLRLSGHKVTLKAKLPQLLAQVVELVPMWEEFYDYLVEKSEAHFATVKAANGSLVSCFADYMEAPKTVQKGTVITTIIGRPSPAMMVA